MKKDAKTTNNMIIKAELSREEKKRKKKYVKVGDVVGRTAKYDDTGNMSTFVRDDIQ